MRNLHRMTDSDLRAGAIAATQLAIELNARDPALADLLWDAGARALEELLARALGSYEAAAAVARQARTGNGH